MAIDQVVHMVAMRHRFMAAAGPVHMAGVMPGAGVVGGAGVRVARRHLDHVLIHVVAMVVVEMAVMQIVHMAAMTYGGMPAAPAVLVRVVGVVRLIAAGHGVLSGTRGESQRTDPVVHRIVRASRPLSRYDLARATGRCRGTLLN